MTFVCLVQRLRGWKRVCGECLYNLEGLFMFHFLNVITNNGNMAVRIGNGLKTALERCKCRICLSFDFISKHIWVNQAPMSIFLTKNYSPILKQMLTLSQRSLCNNNLIGEASVSKVIVIVPKRNCSNSFENLPKIILYSSDDWWSNFPISLFGGHDQNRNWNFTHSINGRSQIPRIYLLYTNQLGKQA